MLHSRALCLTDPIKLQMNSFLILHVTDMPPTVAPTCLALVQMSQP